jgi:dihydrofolate reductase
MPRIVCYIATSVDGYIAGPDHNLAWLEPYENPSEDHGFRAFRATLGAAIMGWNTYEKALSLPGAIDEDLPTYVVSGIPSSEKRSNLSFVSGTNLSALVAEIRQRTKRDIWLVGGGKLVQSFLREQLIDEFILSVVPVLLGQGIPLFGTLEENIPLETVATQTFPDGIVQIRYRIIAP